MAWVATAVAVVGAAVSYQQGVKNAEAMSANGVRQLKATYAAGAAQERELADQSRTDQEDVATAAQRSLSMARVIAAEGGGGLEARARNIAAAAATDSSRIEENRLSGISSTRSGMAAGALQNDQTQADAAATSKAATVQFLTSLASTAANAYGSKVREQKLMDSMKNNTADYKNPSLYVNYLGGK